MHAILTKKSLGNHSVRETECVLFTQFEDKWQNTSLYARDSVFDQDCI